MAVKKSEKKPVERQEPTRDDIVQATLWIARNTNRVPTFWGPTATGKTFTAAAMARESNASLITVLLQQETPEEIAGIQVPIKGQLVAQMPFWFRTAQEVLDTGRGVVIFLDELGLARKETAGAVLTFLRDRHLRGNVLTCGQHDTPNCATCICVIAATNPAEFEPPMRSRLAFIHFPSDRKAMVGMSTTSVSKRVAAIAPLTHESHPSFSNVAPPAPVTVDMSALAVTNRFVGDFWNLTQPARELIAASVLPPAVVEEVFREDNLSTPSIKAQVENPDLIRRVVADMDATTAAANLTAVFNELSQHDLDTALNALGVVLDVTYSDEELLTVYLENPKSEAAEKWWTELDADRVAQFFKDSGLAYPTPEGLRGKLIDNLLVQTTPDTNELQHLMSDEVREEWLKRFK